MTDYTQANHKIKPFKKQGWFVSYQYSKYGCYCDTLEQAIRFAYNYIEHDIESGFWTKDSIIAHCKKYGYAKGNYDIKEDAYWWGISKV